MKKKLVTETLQSYIDFEGMSLDEITELIKSYKETYKEYQKLHFEVYRDYNDYDYNDSNGRTVLLGQREETDKEFKVRQKAEAKVIEQAKALKEKQEEAEQKLYEKLKEKYEK